MENKKELIGKNVGCANSTFDSRDAFLKDFQNVKDINDFKKLMDEMNSLSMQYSAVIRTALEKRKNWVINHEYENLCTIWLKTSDVTKNYPICSNTLRKHRNS
ncbi:MAG: hypothetical protein K9H16_09395, partial [Bacteroidales bacterium]|nr:hypothetical protein [Bacteroidales bacterium]